MDPVQIILMLISLAERLVNAAEDLKKVSDGTLSPEDRARIEIACDKAKTRWDSLRPGA